MGQGSLEGQNMINQDLTPALPALGFDPIPILPRSSLDGSPRMPYYQVRNKSY